MEFSSVFETKKSAIMHIWYDQIPDLKAVNDQLNDAIFMKNRCNEVVKWIKAWECAPTKIILETNELESLSAQPS